MKEKKSRGDIIYNLFYTIFKKKFLAIAVFFSTFLGIIFGTYLVTPIWKADAKLKVQYIPKQQLTMFDEITTNRTIIPGINPANDVIQMLMSKELAEKLVLIFERDKLWEKRDNNPQNTREKIRWFLSNYLNPIAYLRRLGFLQKKPHTYLAQAVKEFQNDLLEIELEEDTTVINLFIWGESPKIAMDMCNTFIRLLLEKNLEFSKQPITKTIESTKNHLIEADEKLKEMQETLGLFKETTGFVLFEEEVIILLERLDQYERDLIAKEIQLLSLRFTKKESHPDVRSMKSQINEIKNQIIPAIRLELKELTLNEHEIEKLTMEINVREQLYALLNKKMLELEMLRDSPIGDLEIKIIDPAKLYSNVSPNWPKRALTIPLGFIGSLLVCLFFIFFLEYWNSSYRSVKDLEEDIGLPVLGALPKFKFFDTRKYFKFLFKEDKNQKKKTNILAQCSHIIDQFILNTMSISGKQFLITSPGVEEGKSTIASLLSQSLVARGKRVLLVEANFKSPTLDVAFKRYRPKIHNMKLTNELGLMDLYKGDLDYSDVVKNIADLDILFAGDTSGVDMDLFKLFASQKMINLFDSFKNIYDFIFIDSPCIKKYRDAIILSSLSDGTILITEANKTPRRTILMSLNRIKKANGEIIGIILNKQINYVPRLIQDMMDFI